MSPLVGEQPDFTALEENVAAVERPIDQATKSYHQALRRLNGFDDEGSPQRALDPIPCIQEAQDVLFYSRKILVTDTETNDPLRLRIDHLDRLQVTCATLMWNGVRAEGLASFRSP